jgi:hypothetical protein
MSTTTSSASHGRAPSRIEYNTNEKSLRELVEKLKNERLRLPPHQREFCWPLLKSQRFVSTVMTGLPTTAILMSRERNSDIRSLEDGCQRLGTMRRFLDDEFLTDSAADDIPAEQRGKKYSELPIAVQRQIDNYQFCVITYENATIEQAVEIFDRFNNGVALSPGERYHSLEHISPIVKFTVEQLLTPGQGLHDEMAPVWGSRAGEDHRYGKLKNAVAIMMGLAFGSGAITHKWEEIRREGWIKYELSDAKKAEMIANLRRIRDIYAEVNRQVPNGTKKIKGLQWNVGQILGYIIHSLDRFPGDYARLSRGWVAFLVRSRRDLTIINSELKVDAGKARSYNQDRWEMGYLRVFDPEEAARRARTVENDDDDYEDDDTEDNV